MRVSTSAKASQFFQFTALWIYLPCSIQEKQKKLQKLVPTWSALVIKNSPGSAAYHLDCYASKRLRCSSSCFMTFLCVISHFKVCDAWKPGERPTVCELEHITGYVRTAGTVRMVQRVGSHALVAQNGNLSWRELTHACSQRPEAGIVLGLSEDYAWYWSRKLFSWKLALVGRTSQKQRKVNVREKSGCIISKGRQGNWAETGQRLGHTWRDCGKEQVTEYFHLKYHSASSKSSVCFLHLGRLNLGVTCLKYLSINIIKKRVQQGPDCLSSPVALAVTDRD